MIKKNEKILKIIEESENELTNEFKIIEKNEIACLENVLNTFNECGLAERHFVGSTGYGISDIGREITCEIFAKVFKAEYAYVSPLFTSGTSAISHTLLGILRPGDTILCITGRPYDTLETVIFGEGNGSLKDYKINYQEVELLNDNFDLIQIKTALTKYNPKVVYIQRSRGYSLRNALTIKKIEEAISFVKSLTNSIVIVDNCYGEFVEGKEPIEIGADLMVSSMIKNIGGGIATTGAYVAGKRNLVELVANHLTSPALGFETGSYELGYRKFLQGLFIAPHTVAECKKVVRLASLALHKLGYKCVPNVNQEMSDIVCMIELEDKDKLVKFCKAIQNASAVDSNAVVEPCEMAGYEDQVVMASGSFTLGSSIELSCDAPMRPPYCAYLQGSLCYAHGKLGLINALSNLIEE